MIQNPSITTETTYLGRGQTTRNDEFQPELSFPMNLNSHTYGKVAG